MLIRILEVMIPVIVVAGLGYLYCLRYRTDLAAINAISVNVFLPALVFTVMSSQDFDLTRYPGLAIAAAAVFFGSGLIAWPIANFLKYDVRTFVPPMMFNNCGNLGLPLALLAFGDSGLAPAIVLLIVTNLLYFSFGIYIVDQQVHWRSVLLSPPILASVAGLVVSLWGVPVPTMIATPIAMLGDALIPVMLFALGIRLVDVNLDDWKIGLIAAVLCPLTALVVALGIQPLLQLPDDQFRQLLLYCALPPAVLVYLVAEQYQQEPQKVAAIVGFGNIAAIIIVPAMLPFVLPVG
ncbi:MAG: AEC family transporter [Arenicellales bacterium]|mgnify:FL=1|nr:AEC family transporter [Arenicellales bacterium]